MKLIKLNKFGDYVTNEKAEEIYLNADKIISVRQTSEYSEIDVAYQNSWRRWKVQETIEEIQYQLEDKTEDKTNEAYIDKELVGQRIKEIRLAKGMNQKEFAKFTSVTVTGVQYWEYGRHLPSKERLKIIADLAGITVQKLLEG